MSPRALALAVMLDLLVGDPRWLPHPIRGIGRLITWLDRLLYPRKAEVIALHTRGVVLCVLVVVSTVVGALAFLGLCRAVSPLLLVAGQVIVASSCLSARSLALESGLVLRRLRAGDLPAARGALAMIVGRDTETLDEQEIARATVETVAENITDGVVAPLFYLAIGGPVAAMAFKAVSTMDSMIGYRDDRYRYFGTCAARLDDLLNFIPARITGFVLLPLAALVVGGNGVHALRVVFADRLAHPSPNAAHGEAAVAGALGIQLGGFATYGGKQSYKPLLNMRGRGPRADDIRRTTITAYATTILCAALAVSARSLLEGWLG